MRIRSDYFVHLIVTIGGVYRLKTLLEPLYRHSMKIRILYRIINFILGLNNNKVNIIIILILILMFNTNVNIKFIYSRIYYRIFWNKIYFANIKIQFNAWVTSCKIHIRDGTICFLIDLLNTSIQITTFNDQVLVAIYIFKVCLKKVFIKLRFIFR